MQNPSISISFLPSCILCPGSFFCLFYYVTDGTLVGPSRLASQVRRCLVLDGFHWTHPRLRKAASLPRAHLSSLCTPGRPWMGPHPREIPGVKRAERYGLAVIFLVYIGAHLFFITPSENKDSLRPLFEAVSSKRTQGPVYLVNPSETLRGASFFYRGERTPVLNMRSLAGTV